MQQRGGTWDLMEGHPPHPTMTATMTDAVAWRLFFNALPIPEAQSVIRLDGDGDLARPLFGARAVIV